MANYLMPGKLVSTADADKISDHNQEYMVIKDLTDDFEKMQDQHVRLLI